jgi:integral membrane protein
MSGAIKRFRVMALVAGVMSLLLWFVYMPAKYLLDNPTIHDYTLWIPIVHGYLYPVYIITAIQFATKARWSFKKMLWLILAGTLPIASIAAERRVVRQYS